MGRSHKEGGKDKEGVKEMQRGWMGCREGAGNAARVEEMQIGEEVQRGSSRCRQGGGNAESVDYRGHAETVKKMKGGGDIERLGEVQVDKN